MNIFHIKTKPNGIEMVQDFIEKSFICIGYSNIGDLTNKDKQEIQYNLESNYGYIDSQLRYHTRIVNLFVNTIKKGDVVLIVEDDWAHIGILGGYEYIYETEVIGTCHMRPVYWVKKIEKDKLNNYVQDLLKSRNPITKFSHPFDTSELGPLIGSPALIEEREYLKNEALKVVKNALKSDSEKIRLQAALAILNFCK